MAWGLAIAGAASLVGSYLASRSAKKGSRAEAKAAEEATELQREMFYVSREDLAPYREALSYGLEQLMGKKVYDLPEPKREDFMRTVPGREIQMPAGVKDVSIHPGTGQVSWMDNTGEWHMGEPPGGMPTGEVRTTEPTEEFDQEAYAQAMREYEASGRRVGGLLQDPSQVTKMPGYEFGMQQGVSALERAGSARGKLLSSQQRKNLIRFGQDYAQTKYQNYLDPYFRLAGFGGSGTQQGAQLAQNYATQAGLTTMAGGQARGSGYRQQGQIWGDFATSMGQNALMAYYMS